MQDLKLRTNRDLLAVDYWGELSGDKGNTLLPLLPEQHLPDAGHKLSMLRPSHMPLSVLHLVPKNKRVVLSLHVKIRLEVGVCI